MQGQNSNQWIAWRENPHSARYRLHHGISGVFLQIVPWLNVFLVIALFLIVSKRVTVAPGILFDLPAAPLSEGMRDMQSAVLLVPSPGEPALAFFNDIRYRIDDDGECGRLSSALRLSREQNGWGGIVLYAAADVAHGDVIRFVNAARQAGVAEINVAANPSSAE